MKKIGIIGHFGGKEKFLDGQTVKTKVLYEELKKRGYDDIFCVDTYYNNKNRAKLLLDTFKCILSCETIIFLLSGNGLKVFLPILYFAKKVFKRRIFHDVIGGNLALYAKRNPESVKYLKGIDGNWVELHRMKNELEALGIENCTVITNFKDLDLTKAIEMPTEDGKYKFCMFSRVMEEKGVTDAIEAIAEYNSNNEVKVKLNIWGSVEENYKEKFDKLLEKYDFVSYGGRISFDKSVETLTDHIALLFPTHFMEEGCPGTIIDAYSANLPVITSNWHAAHEMVKEFETGWIYPNDAAKTLCESIKWAVDHQEEMIAMRKNCALLAKRYTPDYVMRRIIADLK